MMCGYTGSEDDATACSLVAELAGDGLRAEKGAGEIDIVGSAPFVGRHVDGVRAADDAGEAEQRRDLAEDFERVGEGGGDGCVGAHVDGHGEDAGVWELGV